MLDLTRFASTLLCASWLVVGCGAPAQSPSASVSSASPAPSTAQPAPTTSTRELLATADPKGDTAVDQELRARIATAKAQPRKLDAWILVGRSWVQKARNTGDPGYYLNADAAAEVALELEPQSPLALNLRGLVLLNSHRFPEAKALAESILARDPDDAMALGTLCDAELELGRVQGAIDAAEKMVTKKPDLPSYSRASYLRWLKGDAAGALEGMRLAFDAGRSQKDKEPAAWALSQLATYFWHLGDIAGAEAGYDLTLQYAKGYIPAMVGRARVAMARNKPKVAVELLERALSEQPLAETAWLLGDARAAAGDLAGAEAAWAECVRLGRQADPRTLAMFFATKHRDVAQAVTLAKAELDKRPGPYSRDAYAFALLRAGRVAEARDTLAPVLAMGLAEPGIKYRAALLALASGEEAKGKKLLAELLAKTPSFDATLAAEARRLIAG